MECIIDYENACVNLSQMYINLYIYIYAYNIRQYTYMYVRLYAVSVRERVIISISSCVLQRDEGGNDRRDVIRSFV